MDECRPYWYFLHQQAQMRCKTATPTLQLRHNGCDGVSNHQPRHCLLIRLFRRRWKQTSRPHVTGLSAGNSTVTGEFPAQMDSNTKMFPYDDVIMIFFINYQYYSLLIHKFNDQYLTIFILLTAFLRGKYLRSDLSLWAINVRYPWSWFHFISQTFKFMYPICI